jgi:hypothetical protein
MTDERKIRGYEKTLHLLSLYMLTGSEKMRDLLSTINDWSYSHRVGNGEFTDEEQQEIIDFAFERLEKFS